MVLQNCCFGEVGNVGQGRISQATDEQSGHKCGNPLISPARLSTWVGPAKPAEQRSARSHPWGPALSVCLSVTVRVSVFCLPGCLNVFLYLVVSLLVCLGFCIWAYPSVFLVLSMVTLYLFVSICICVSVCMSLLSVCLCCKYHVECLSVILCVGLYYSERISFPNASCLIPFVHSSISSSVYLSVRQSMRVVLICQLLLWKKLFSSKINGIGEYLRYAQSNSSFRVQYCRPVFHNSKIQKNWMCNEV